MDELTEQQLAAIDWLCTPPPARDYGSEKELAAAIGIAPSTIFRWKKHPAFIKGWEKELARRNQNPDKIQPIMEAMHSKALQGDVKAAELYMKLVDRMTPDKLRIEDGSKPLAEYTNEELIAKLQSVPHGRPGS